MFSYLTIKKYILSTNTNIIVSIKILIAILVNFFYYIEPTWVHTFYLYFSFVPEVFAKGAIWQVFTNMFLHAYTFPMNFIHISANMIGVWSIGNFLETKIGKKPFLYLYFISGLMGSFFIFFNMFDVTNLQNMEFKFNLFSSSINFMKQSTFGASSCLLGLVGALSILAPRLRVFFFIFPIQIRSLVFLILFASTVFQVYGLFPMISHMGHLGGLIGGLLYMFLYSIFISQKTNKISPQLNAPISMKADTLLEIKTQKKQEIQNIQVPKVHSTPLDSPSSSKEQIKKKKQEEYSNKKLLFDDKTNSFKVIDDRKK